MKRPLVIGYVTTDDPRDRRTWSGINYYLLKALEQQVERVEILGPLYPQPVLFLCRVFNQISLRLLGKRFHYRDSFVLSKAYARILSKRLKQRPVDLIIAPAGLAAIALLKTDTPIIHFNDRSVAGAVEYHKVLKDLLDWSREQSLELERRALMNAALTVYTSDWAAAGAKKACPEAARNVVVIPMGANLDRIPDPPAPRDFPPGMLKLLMIGVDWEGKGGPIAFEALQTLKRQGHAAQLIVCGCDVPAQFDDPDLVREGFLSKNDPVQQARLEGHLRTAHFLLLPTRFEAYGIAFCEAAAYGLPVLGTRTGGVPTIVKEGVTGFLFDLDQGGEAYVERIEAMIREPEAWQRMRMAARDRYERYFTWEAFVTRLLAQAEASGLINKAR